MFEKGNKHGKGRHKGSVNRLTSQAREALANALAGEVNKIPQYIKRIKSPEKKIEAISKLLPYFLPRVSKDIDLSIETSNKFVFEVVNPDSKLSQDQITEFLDGINITSNEQ
jgi:hypothetical protein